MKTESGKANKEITKENVLSYLKNQNEQIPHIGTNSDEFATCHVPSAFHIHKCAIEKIQECEAELKIYREALQFYAEGDYTLQYRTLYAFPYELTYGNIHEDAGAKAKQALEAAEKVGKE